MIIYYECFKYRILISKINETNIYNKGTPLYRVQKEENLCMIFKIRVAINMEEGASVMQIVCFWIWVLVTKVYLLYENSSVCALTNIYAIFQNKMQIK